MKKRAKKSMEKKAEIGTVAHTLTIRPAISPTERHKIEDLLVCMGYTVCGGGTYVDMSECDITFEDPRDEI